VLPGRKRLVDRTDLGEKGLVPDTSDRGAPVHRVAPNLRDLTVRNILATQVSVQNILVLGRARSTDADFNSDCVPGFI